MLCDGPFIQLSNQPSDFQAMKIHLRQDFKKCCILLQKETNMVIALYAALFSTWQR
jgi:hypothetical protein